MSSQEAIDSPWPKRCTHTNRPEQRPGVLQMGQNTTKLIKFSIRQAKTIMFLGADIGNDHDLVLTTIKLKLKNIRITKNISIIFDLAPRIFRDSSGILEFAAVNIADIDMETIANNIN
ncbi:hypothetical protein DPMN_119009 [Dreissena polymorpha]|uniref:Uncharacterized protein n=1 Tax=Dreissena polymorpha TaxID=45954 RepID=A0A9D4JQU5_DREPO|nr:hypothetical protein DPMN_119009 [Dreissena polymorpha]